MTDVMQSKLIKQTRAKRNEGIFCLKAASETN